MYTLNFKYVYIEITHTACHNKSIGDEETAAVADLTWMEPQTIRGNTMNTNTNTNTNTAELNQELMAEIQKSLDDCLDRMREIAREEREYHEARIAGALDNVGNHIFSLGLKLDAIEKMQSKQASQLDHGSAFARHSSARLEKHLTAIGMGIMKTLEQIETVGADMHEYARIAYDAAYGSDEPVEIDWGEVE